MSMTSILDQAAGGKLFASVARATSLDEAATRNTMHKLCPAIAQALHDKAEKDEELYQSLLDLIEDGEEASSLDQPQTLTSAEAIADGNQILLDVFGSREKSVAALRKADTTMSEGELNALAPICATTVVAALAKANQPLALAAAQPQQVAGEKGGVISTLIGAIVAGIVSALVKQFTSGTRRRTTSYSTARTKRRTTRSRSTTTRRSRSSTASLENVFKDILGNLGK